MKIVSKVFIIALLLFLSINEVYCYYSIDDKIVNKFHSNKYNIKLNANGGHFDSYNMIIKYNSTTLPTPTRVGYNFLGYSKGTDSNINYNTNISNVDEINNNNLTAKWEPITYSISYNLNGGSISSSEEIKEYNIEKETFTLPTPTREGYNFIGWTGSNGNTPSNVTIEKGSIGDRSYTANWKIKTFTVTYKNTSGGVHATRTVNWNSNIENIGYSTGVDRIFTGWTYNGGSISGVKVKSNITVNANTRETQCYLQTGQAQDGNVSRLTYMQSVLAQKGIGGNIGYHSEGYQHFVSNAYGYSKIVDGGNYLLANAPSSSFPYLRWLAMFCENGYGVQLR